MAELYTTLEKIGEGTFGQVFRAKLKRTGEVFALKKIRLKRVEDGISPATLRELKALQHLEHDNIVRLFDSFAQGSNVVLVLEYVQSDLARLLEGAPTRLCEADVKCLMLMLLHGVGACHECSIIHRVRAYAAVLLSHSSLGRIPHLRSRRARLPRTLAPRAQPRHYSHAPESGPLLIRARSQGGRQFNRPAHPNNVRGRFARGLDVSLLENGGCPNTWALAWLLPLTHVS
jgi:hypothetical protein